MEHMELTRSPDTRPPRGNWAAGDYICTCYVCRKYYIGAKRSHSCAACAYAASPVLEYAIRTGAGTMFHFADMSKNVYSLFSIATNLSRIPRFLGSTHTPYSVAAHCVQVAETLLKEHGPLYALYGLLHDAHEAFISDIPTPLLRYMRDVYGFDYHKEIGTPIDEWVFKNERLVYPFPADIKTALHTADKRWGATEGAALVPNYEPEPTLERYKHTFWRSTPEKDREDYMEMYLRLHALLSEQTEKRTS